MKVLLACVMAGSLLGATSASAKVDMRQEHIQFEKGTSRATITDQIRGDQIVDYQVRGGVGQSMVAILKPTNLAAYFNILPPGSDVAIFVGSTSGHRFEAALPADGVYTIRVALMRSAARRNETAHYTLEVGLAGGGKTTAAERSVKISSVAETLPDLWLFLKQLSAGVEASTMRSTEQLIERCQAFYTAERMAAIEAVVPGWNHMASFEHGKTLWHINVAMVALLQLDEYRSMSPNQQTVQQWIVFLHDVAKEPDGGRDHRHSFRSAAHAGRIMPQLGFPVTAAYRAEFQEWFHLTDTATRFDAVQALDIQDNSKLPSILSGARRLFAEPTRTAVSVIALHQSITSLAAWPVKAPLTDDQVIAYVDQDIFPALLALTLADSGGWNLFDPPTLEAMYKETRAIFRDLPRSPSQ
jgi:hypothetical protein